MPRPLALVVALCLCVAALSLGDEVMEFDPAQYADVAARILVRGDWLHLQDMNGPFINKPPLMIWAQAMAMAVLGPTSVAARLPAILFAALTVLGTFFVGRRLQDVRLGAVAAAFVSGSVALHHAVADPKVDLSLMAMTTWAIWAALERRWLLAWLFAALAVLAKGPVGPGIVVLALLPEFLRTKPPSPPWRERGRAVLGALLFAALVIPFYAAQGASGARYLLWTQAFARILGGGDFQDSTTPLYFLHTGLWALWPMTPLLIAALGRGAHRLWRERTLPARLERIPAWWLLLTFAVISLSRYKLPQYVYWVAPPAALLAAGEILRLSEGGLLAWRRAYAALAVGAAALGLLLLALVFPPGGWGWLILLALALPAIAWAVTRAGEAWLRTAALAASSALGFLFLYQAWLHPRLLDYQPWREVAAEVRALPPSEPLVLVDVAPTFALSFYSQRPLRPASPGEVSRERPRLFVASEAALQHLDGAKSVLRLPRYPVSIPRGRFLRETTREGELGWIHLAGW